MNDLKKLQQISKRVCADLEAAVACFETAWAFNGSEATWNAISMSDLGYTHKLIFNSLIHRSALSISRTVGDRTTSYACVSEVIRISRCKACREELLEEIRNWPTIHSDNEADAELGTMIGRISLDRFLVTQFKSILKTFRNRELAHAAIRMTGENPTYAEMSQAVRLCENLYCEVRRLSWGEITSADSLKRVAHGSAEEYLGAVIRGAKKITPSG